MNPRRNLQAGHLRRTTLALSLGLGLGLVSMGTMAQSSTGSVFGRAAPGADTSVVIHNVNTGQELTTSVDSAGRYRFASLPAGTYTVTLRQSGSDVVTRDNVTVNIAGGTEVSFTAADVTTLAEVSVSASALPSIDVSSVDTRTVFTADQLAKLPLARNVAAVALLAPSVVNNTSYGVPSFGGAASSENAYYINGFPVTNPLTNLGFSTLPYDAIDQMQVLTGGYGASFGRATGGVINVTTKRGTNTWKGGVAGYWEPEYLRANPRNSYYPNTGHFPDTDGTLYTLNNQNQYWRTTYGAYLSGPLIKDRLFIYANAEMQKREGTSVRTAIASAPNPAGYNQYSYSLPRWTAKIDWNITDNHIVEFTGVSDKTEYNAKYTGFDYSDFSHNDTQTGGLHTKDGGELYIGKYTGYLTDNLTVTGQYGEQTIDHLQEPWNFDASCPRIAGYATPANQMPGIVYNVPCQKAASTPLPGANDKVKAWRFDVEYRIGDHDIRVGYDSNEARSYTGSEYAGGYVWVFMNTANKNAAVDAGHGVGSPASAGGSGLGVPGSNKGYFARRQYFTQVADVQVKQQAQYIEDRWQVTDRLLLSLGLRNEQFSNYDGSGARYVAQRHQIAPRLGASWDVYGDSSMKVFANAGRYHLALPNNVAVRAASASLFTQEFFTYTGTDPRTGAPTGLVNIPVDTSLGYTCPGNPYAISSNLECGTAPDPRTVAAKDLKSHYQDEYILGMEQQLGADYNWGIKATYRDLRSAIDDTCAPALGGRCFTFNPGETNTFAYDNGDGTFTYETLTTEQLGFPKLKRKYVAVDMFAAHTFNEKWYAKVNYTWSRNFGNTEGQLLSDIDTGGGGQSDVSQTQDWDLPQLMRGAGGRLANDRTHQIKLFGYYQMTPEWRFGASGIVSSGRPTSCFSFYPTADAGLYNGSYYHYCGLAGSGTNPASPGYIPPSADYKFAPRGKAGDTPWTYQLNLNASYSPAWATGLELSVDVLNVLNQQTAQWYDTQSASNRVTYSRFHRQELNYTPPRQFRLTARYDFSL
ncbi:MAG TPA: TonB-dependent receptor [Rhodanobacter sp.]